MSTTPDYAHRSAIQDHMKQTAFTALIAAGLMLLFGYNAWSGELHGTSTSRLYNLSVTAYVWTLLIGGGAMLASAGLLFAAIRGALLLDAAATAIIAVLFLSIGGTQLAFEGLGNLQAGLLVLFGLLFLRSAWGSWSVHQAATPASPEPAEAAASLDPEVKAVAMERLLSRKRVEAQAAPQEPAPASPTVRVAAEPAVPPASDTVHDSAPEGFLAALGRKHDSERTQS